MKVLIVGSTGLVGGGLLNLMLKDDEIESIEIWVRKSISTEHPKLITKIVDFNRIEDLGDIDVDAVCISLGTTIKKAGTKEAFRKVDFGYVTSISKKAKKDGINQLIVVSSLGANPDSGNFYLRTKGEMEAEILNLDIENIAVLRPALLVGDRKENRLGERAAEHLFKIINPLLRGKLKKYRSIKSIDVAQAMLKLSKGHEKGRLIIENDEIEKIADS